MKIIESFSHRKANNCVIGVFRDICEFNGYDFSEDSLSSSTKGKKVAIEDVVIACLKEFLREGVDVVSLALSPIALQ